MTRLKRVSRKKTVGKIASNLAEIGKYEKLELISEGQFALSHLTAIKKMNEHTSIILHDVKTLCPLKQQNPFTQKTIDYNKKQLETIKTDSSSSMAEQRENTRLSANLLKGVEEKWVDYTNGEHIDFEEKVLAMADIKDDLNKVQEIIFALKNAIVNEILSSF